MAMKKIYELTLLSVIAYAAAIYIYKFHSPYVQVKKMRMYQKPKS